MFNSNIKNRITCILDIPVLSRKFLQKKEEKNPDKITQKKSKSKGKKEFEEIDPLGFHEKRLDFRVEFDEIKTPEDKIKNEITDTRQQTRNVNNFQNLVNAYIKERVDRINSIRNSKTQFDLEIAALSGEDTTVPPEKIKSPLFKLKESDVNEILKVLEIEQQGLKEKIEKYETKLNESKNAFEQSKKKIKRLQDHLKERSSPENSHLDAPTNFQGGK